MTEKGWINFEVDESSFDPCLGSDLQLDFEVINNGCSAPCEVSIQNNSVNVQTYFWDFGDGEISTDAFPTHEYQKQGNYNLKWKLSG